MKHNDTVAGHELLGPCNWHLWVDQDQTTPCNPDKPASALTDLGGLISTKAYSMSESGLAKVYNLYVGGTSAGLTDGTHRQEQLAKTAP